VYPLAGAERVGESELGDLVTDAMLLAYAPDGAQVAVFNAAGIRDTLPSTYAPSYKTLRRPAAGYAAGPPYDVVVGDAYTVLPFGDACVVRPVSGATLWSMLEHGVESVPAPFTGFLQVAGLRFTYSASAPAGARVRSVTLDDGTALARDDTRTFVLVDNDFIDGGGDGYTMLAGLPPAPSRDVAADVLLGYVKTHAPLGPTLSGRITQVP
jgi:5'-nucleotidase